MCNAIQFIPIQTKIYCEKEWKMLSPIYRNMWIDCATKQILKYEHGSRTQISSVFFHLFSWLIFSILFLQQYFLYSVVVIVDLSSSFFFVFSLLWFFIFLGFCWELVNYLNFILPFTFWSSHDLWKLCMHTKGNRKIFFTFWNMWRRLNENKTPLRTIPFTFFASSTYRYIVLRFEILAFRWQT